MNQKIPEENSNEDQNMPAHEVDPKKIADLARLKKAREQEKAAELRLQQVLEELKAAELRFQQAMKTVTADRQRFQQKMEELQQSMEKLVSRLAATKLLPRYRDYMACLGLSILLNLYFFFILVLVPLIQALELKNLKNSLVNVFFYRFRYNTCTTNCAGWQQQSSPRKGVRPSRNL